MILKIMILFLILIKNTQNFEDLKSDKNFCIWRVL